MVLYIGFRWGLLQMIKKDTRYSDTENPKMLNFFTDRVEPPLKGFSLSFLRLTLRMRSFFILPTKIKILHTNNVKVSKDQKMKKIKG